ncbi:flagellar protein FlgN [Desulfogranum mediterraneum]|uniref:flagellar protein FlgN n=1 Tax=Desulfogranum mediterraneum TaxID=160661 RepID=UPI00048E6EA6|nr:flagellar protein FlgN [Desulfogranum mediterraneum]
MTRETVRELLTQLRDTIRNEREHARQLDLQAMANDMAQKEALIQTLQVIKTLDPEEQALAREIHEENRRNAFLFRATLNWIQSTMEFFGRKTVPTTYGQTGAVSNTPVNGRLLSGRI